MCMCLQKDFIDVFAGWVTMVFPVGGYVLHASEK